MKLLTRSPFGLMLSLALLLNCGSTLSAMSGHRSYASHGSSAIYTSRYHARGYSTHSPRSSRCATCARDSRGRIKRSPEARREFQRGKPCPSTGRTSGGCPCYVIDHITPLKRGGADAPSNMQWQTKADAKAKDRIE